MRNYTRWILFASIAVVMCAVVFDFGQTVSSQSPRKGGSLKAKPAAPNGSPALENFDIRIRTQAADAAETSDNQGAVSTGVQIETRKPLVANQSQRETAAAIVSSMNAAQESLAQRVPGLRVEYNETLRVPEVVDVNGLTLAAATGSTEETVRGFVSENAAAYGLTRSQAAKLKKFSDYTNPAGNLSFVELEQEINGVPVFQGYVRGILSADGRLVRTTGLLAPGLNSASVDTTPRISVTDAVAAGAKSINLKVKGTGTSLSVKEEGENGITKVVTGGPFDEDVKTSLVIFPLVPGTGRLAYAMTLWQPVYSYYVLIDATTGELLWRKCITAEQTVPVTYNIYNNDSPTPSAPIPGASNTIAPPVPQPPGITRTDVTLVSENPQDSLGWIPDSAGPNPVTTGNNVDAGLDISAPNGIDTNGRAQATNRVFRFDYKPDGSADPTGSNNPTDAQFRMGAVTNLFFWTNRYNDVLYNLGFTEAARNFQTNNFGRGGLGNDPVLAEAQDSSGTNNANFNTPPDGTPGRMQMYLWPGTVARDGDLDQEVVFHELTHGVSNRLHANGSGLNSDMAAGMGEGWGDFYGITMLALRSPDGDDGKRLYAFGAYDTRNYYRAIRRFPYAVKSALAANGKSHNPVTFADIDPAQADFSDAAFPQSAASANEVHNQGEIWCSMLIEVRAKLIERLGLEPGSTRVLQVVTDGMKFDPVNPTILNARNSIIGADCAGYNGVDERDIWEGFRIRGAGFRASTSGIHVTENFEGPNLKLLNVTSQVVGGGNNDGVVDPGETVRLTLPLQNILCGTTVPEATATISTNGNTAQYGQFNPGVVNTATVDYTVPVGTACGTSIPITITVNSILGPITYVYNLNIGQPAALSTFENFDGVTAPALPAGWSTQRTGAGMPWQTSTVNPDTAPNDAFSPNPTNPGTSDLTSPTFPVNTGQARLSFRNLYNMEDGFDGMTLQIKIGNGAFQDIIAAGGSFVSGGYNGETPDAPAWTGLSGGTTANPTYITSVVNLPPAASGQLVQLRWHVFGDPNTIAPGQAGVRIDTIQLATSAQACNPFGVSTVSISGHVNNTSNVNANGIQITLSGTTNATTTTDSSGNYSFPNLVSGGNYTVTPTTPGYDYTPPSRTYNNLTTNVTDANFTLSAQASICGRVTTENGATGLDGITVTLSGSASATTTTSGGGFYCFGPLTKGGNYTVTPSGGGNNFTPPSRTYNNLQGPVTDANFVASENIACNALGSVVTGQIAAGDPTQAQRVFRSGTPSDCGGRPFPGYNADPSPVARRYDQYTYTNGGPTAICVRVSVRADSSGFHSAAYLGSFNPADVGQNYLGDLGVSYTANSDASYSFTVPAGATYVIVMHEITPNTPATINYTFARCAIVPPTNNAAATPPQAQPGQVLITEFRQSVGSTTSSDEYIELYNNTDATISINGCSIALFNSTFGGDVFLTLPAGTTIPRRGHLIIANTAAGGYSLTPYAGPDITHANANLMPDNQGFGLIDPSRTVMIDSVGFRGNSGNLPYIEGNGLTPTSGNRPNVQHAYVRKTNLNTSFPQDTGDNANDFQLVSVTAAVFNATAANGGPIQSILGAPGPENKTSPVERSTFLRPSLLDPSAPANGGENRRRLACGDPAGPACDPNNSTLGFLTIRRKITNNTGSSVTRLRFRIVDITTLGSPGGGAATTQADLRALNSSQIVVTVNGSPATVEGTTLERPATTPPMQPSPDLGGGLNHSMAVGTVAFATPLLNGDSVNVQFLLGVQKDGNFRFVVNIEAVP